VRERAQHLPNVVERMRAPLDRLRELGLGLSDELSPLSAAQHLVGGPRS
jgi:hypothetical protein